MFSTAFRAFLTSMFAVFGIAVGITVFSGLGMIGGGLPGQPQAEMRFTPKVLPNADGKRRIRDPDSPVILVVDIVGLIGTELLNRHHITQQLVESREGVLRKHRVKGIILNVNSVGGSLIDIDSIFHALKAYKETYKIPVFAFVDGICASGGIYIASVADKIYATNTSLIGSVGVIIPSALNFSGAMEKIGIESKTIHSGRGKDELNPLRPWGPEDGKSLQRITDFYYQNFVDLMVKQRPSMNREQLISEIGAEVFPAEAAKGYGFIDVTDADMNSVINDIVAAAGIEGGRYQVLGMDRKPWLSDLFRGSSDLLQGRMTHRFQVTGCPELELSGPVLHVWRPGS